VICGLSLWLAGFSFSACAQTIPDPPAGLVATAVSTNQINLSWMDNSTNEDSFAIERAPDIGGQWAQIATVGANVANYSDTGLSPGTRYWYRVQAYNTGGNSDYSNQASATTPALCPRVVVGWGSGPAATPPAGLEWVTAIASGWYHSLALKRDGTVVSWGQNFSGQTNTPSGLSNVVAIAAEGSVSLALKADGTVTNWGDSYYGSPPAGLSNVVAIAAGRYFSLALKSDGTVTNWGDSYYGKPPAGLNNVVAIAAHDYNPLALKSDGTVVAWGYAPTPPAGLNNVVAIAAGGNHSLALKSDSTVVGWGDLNAATPPAGLTNVVAIAAGSGFSLALKRDGTVVGWGSGSAATTPARLPPAVAIAAGMDYGLALTTPCSLSAPAALRATAVSSTLINLSWLDDSPDEDGFRVERASDIGGFPGAWTQIATVGTNVANYSDTGRLAHTAYWYRVRAYNGGGNSDYSNPATVTTPNLEPPSGLAATGVSTNQIDLSWKDNSTTEDGFEIERAPDIGGSPGTWTQIVTVGTNVTAYSDTGLLANTKYWYRARTYNAVDISDYSNQANATTPALCPRLVVGWGNNQYGQATPPAGLEWVVAIAAGYDYTLALKSNGTVVAWGNNSLGQTNVPAGLSNVVAIDAGDFCSLALKSDGTVVGWGSGPSATPPAGLSNVVAIAAGRYTSLALKSDGTVVGWGGGPTMPPGLSNVVAIASGTYFNLALKSDGNVVQWGGSTPPSGLTNVVAIAAGDSHGTVLKGDGTVVSWGSGYAPPAGLSNVVAIAAGSNHDLALKSDGTVVAWGFNSSGQTNVPAGLTRVTAIAAGGSHSLALTTPCSLGVPSTLTATVVSASQINLAWLDNSGDENGFKIERSTDGTNFTQIAQVLPNTTSYRNTGLWPGTTYYYRVRPYNSGGNGDSSSVASAGTPAPCLTSIVNWGSGPTPPPDLTNAVAIAASLSFYDLALKSDGTVVSWGGGPTPPPGLSNVVAIAAGAVHGLALKNDRTIVGWGYPPAATPPVGLSNVVAIAAGYRHSLALKSDGTVVGWGVNTSGETNVPAGLSGVVGIAAGGYFSLALKCDGTVIGWGRNDYGQTNPPAALRAVAIAASYYQSLALTSYGTVVGWGNRFGGQLNLPSGLSGVVGIAAGDMHGLALKSDGMVVAWGNGSAGQTNVPAGLSGVVAIGAGVSDSLAISCAPTAPSSLFATTITKNRIDLSWTDNSINESRFGIERADSLPGTWTEIGSVDSDVTTYPDTGLSCGETYYYRVRAYDAAGGSPYSSIASENTSPDDLDCDGIADAWMQQYFGHPYGQASDNSRATDDADGDGQNNLAEFQAGTDPTNSASAFRILEIAPADEDMLITWEAVGGKWYIVQTATNVTGSLSNTFYDLNPVIGSAGTNEFPLSVIHLGGATNAPVRFYRVRLVP
jgi:alpha-tubulin suppressor-like RCC1 family protein